MRTVSVRLEKKFRSKYECAEKARELLKSGQIDMDEKELAEEIYAHARVYYWALPFSRLPGFRFIARRADPVDLQDGGDKRFRRRLYRLIWKCTR